MNSLPNRAIWGAVAAVLAAVAVAASGSLPFAIAIASAAASVFVAFAAQSQRLRDERRLVYRPVYARRQGVRGRVRSDD